MRTRIGSSLAVLAAVVGLATSVAGPIYQAFGGDTGTSAVTVHAGKQGRIMK